MSISILVFEKSGDVLYFGDSKKDCEEYLEKLGEEFDKKTKIKQLSDTEVKEVLNEILDINNTLINDLRDYIEDY